MESATASEDPSASAEATTNGLTPENSKGRELRLSDFQEPPVTSGWQEKRYDVASITNTMGIGTKLDWQNDDEIELRLANKFQKVTFTAGQANDSRSSDLIVRVAIFADGKEIETVDVPFNDAHAFEVKAANVNALKITFKALDQKQEMPQIDDSTIGVILNVGAEGCAAGRRRRRACPPRTTGPTRPGSGRRVRTRSAGEPPRRARPPGRRPGARRPDPPR